MAGFFITQYGFKAKPDRKTKTFVRDGVRMRRAMQRIRSGNTRGTKKTLNEIADDLAPELVGEKNDAIRAILTKAIDEAYVG